LGAAAKAAATVNRSASNNLMGLKSRAGFSPP
jgi:hypothetical protein